MCAWNKLVCPKRDLQLLGTLNGGQSFRWRKAKEPDRWIGVFGNRVWILEQKDDHILYQVLPEEKSDLETDHEKLLRDYFQLDYDLRDLYEDWSGKDPNFKKAAQQFYGIRILKQDPVENIFSFICSSNNNIARISSMVEKLAKFYGTKICDFDQVEYYSFPEIRALAEDGVEKKLKENGFGYRAKYVSESAKAIVKGGGSKWVEELKALEYKEAKKKLMTLTGIGAKVADCVCLMSLGHLQSIPIDTHIYQIASRLYMPKLAKQKTVTEKIYNEIGDHFRNLYGPLAGWAHTILFCADLKKFQSENGISAEQEKSRKRKLK